MMVYQQIPWFISFLRVIIVHYILRVRVENHITDLETDREESPNSRAGMASMTMTASFLAGSTMAKQPFTAPRRGLIVAKASGGTEGERVNLEMKNKEESGSGRRDLVFAAAAAAAYSIAKVAMADDEPKPGSPDAKKKYAPVCVTMPTARICHK